MARARQSRRLRELVWTTSPPPVRRLRREGYHVLPFARLARRVARSRPGSGSRSSLKNPAAGILDLYARHPRVALLEVPCWRTEDLEILHGYVLEPAFRAGCRLLVGADRELADLDPDRFGEPEWGCPWTLERLRHLAGRYVRPRRVAAPPAPVPWWRRLWRRLTCRGATPHGPVPRLDPQQNAAIAAGDGVVQVIAPAGSGKTTVLIERVRELVRRRTPPERILCTTFNRDACAEMAARLQAAGIFGVTVRSFHGLGLDILREEGQLRRELGPVDGAIWEQLARRAGQAAGCSGFSATRAREAVGHFKLAQMITPEVACRRAVALPAGRRAEALVYAFYEDFLQRSERLDFDDLIGRSIALLQRSGAIRHRWQDRFHRVLVDEYQDIEPAQALLVGLLAAPHDSLFCVGDEDQCIYAWRRASVQRVIDLDQTYPGLERYPLVRNYRCGRRITAASRRLIGHNRRRFRKPLLSGLREPGRISLVRRPDLDQGARFVAGRIRDAEPGTTAVLARTGRLLDTVAAAWGSPAAPGTESDPPPAGDPVRHLGGVELATVHGAKGREWDRVILFGADQGSFPLAWAVKDPTAPGGGGLEDERRLFYVALTRARLRLEIVSCTARPSQFLREAGLR